MTKFRKIQVGKRRHRQIVKKIHKERYGETHLNYKNMQLIDLNNFLNQSVEQFVISKESVDNHVSTSIINNYEIESTVVTETDIPLPTNLSIENIYFIVFFSSSAKATPSRPTTSLVKRSVARGKKAIFHNEEQIKPVMREPSARNKSKAKIVNK